jgi:hypothetical protein
MRTSITVSILVSLVLIGGASWTKFANTKKSAAGLIASESKTIDWSDVARSYDTNPSSTSTPTSTPLTSTQVIGRQLIYDYIDLASQGGGSEENIKALADKYVDSLPTLNNSEVMSSLELKAVSDSPTHFREYAARFLEIHNEFAAAAKTSSLSAVNLAAVGTPLYKTSGNIGKAYIATAEKLRTMSVPLSLGTLHIELVNTYYSSGSALNSLTESEKDPAVAFAGIIALKQNSETEQDLQSAIELVLTRNGI